MATIVRQEKYIKADVGNNNNKFWFITLFDNGDVITEWGRVGKKSQSKTFPGAGSSFVDEKCREKESYRNGEIPYRKLNLIQTGEVKVQTSTQPIKSANVSEIAQVAKSQIKVNNPLVCNMLEHLAKVNAHQIATATGGKITYSDITGKFSTPLGIITEQNIDDATNLLIKIGNMVSAGNWEGELKDLTNDYMMLVPQSIGMKRLDLRDFWKDISKVQYQNQILDNLRASIASVQKTPVKTIDVPEKKIFDCQLYLVEDGKIIDQMRKFYRATRKDQHVCAHLDVKNVYEVCINTVRDGFERRGAKMDNILDIWHGTRVCNVLSILKSGLMLPHQTSAHITGAMFGPGIYGAPSSTKSLNYAYGYWGGKGGYDNNCFMFAIKMAMGKYYIPNKPFDGHPPKGYDSAWAKANKSGVANDECIVYSTDQVDLKYLLEFSPNGK